MQLKKIAAVFLSLALFCCLLPVTPAAAVDMPQDVQDQFARCVYVDPDTGLTIPYRLYIPDSTNSNGKYSFLLFLHGAGERGTDNQSQIRANSNILTRIVNDTDPERNCIILAPQCPSNKQWVNTPWGNGSYSVDEISQSSPMQAVMKIIDELVSDYRNTPIDESRMYISGISMGGYGTWDTIIRNPDMFAAAIPVCGAGDPTKAELIKDIPIWTFHSSDDGTVPVSGTRDMASALEAVDGNITYTEYSGYGHGSWEPAFAEPELLNWLFSQRKIWNIRSVDNPEPLTVPYGTAFEDLNLPDTVTVQLDNGDELEIPVEWSAQDGDGNAYDGNTAGSYTLTGALSTDEAANPENLTAAIEITVAQRPTLTGVVHPDPLRVPYGTAFEDLELPDTVTVQLSDGTETVMDILQWYTTNNPGDTPYDGNVSGTYSLRGELDTGSTSNPNNLAAVISVTVEARPVTPGDVDGNGSVDIQDVMSACKILARKNTGTDPTDEELARADLDGSGDVDIGDIMSICRILASQLG